MMIGASSFSSEWLITTLNDADPSFEATSAVKSVKEISGGKGFASKVYLCDLGSSSVVLKVPDSGKLDAVSKPDETADLPAICAIHDREVDFYDEFSRLELIRAPRMYKTGRFGPDGKGQAFLLMESLAERGELGSLVDGFNRQQLISIARDFARFQAYFLKLEDNTWQETFHTSLPDSTIRVMVDLLKKLKELNPALFAEGIDQLLPSVGNKEFMNWTSFHAYKTLNLPAVLVHGNLWTNNIFWKKNSDGTVGNKVEAYIDWQLAHTGCLTSDLASVLVLCTEADVRRQHTDDILQEYYQALSQELGNSPPFTFQQVKDLYEINYFAQCQNLLFAAVYHSAMVAHLPENVQEVQIFKFQSRAKFAITDCLTSLDKLKQKFEKKQ